MARVRTVRKRVVGLCVLAVASACATKPPPTGPRSLGHGASLYKGSGELRIDYGYEPLGPRDLVLHVEMAEVGGAEVGAVEVAVSVAGFDVLEGDLRWTAAVPAGGSDRHPMRLRARGVGVASVSISHRHVAAGETVSTTTLTFRVHDEEEIRPCRPADEECRGAGPAES